MSSWPRPGLHYPPELPEEQCSALITSIKDWQLTHGSLLKLVRTEEEHTILARPIGVSVFPTIYPRQCFEEATSLQKPYNELYAKISEDDEWLLKTLEGLIRDDRLTGILWGIYQEVKNEGYVQDLTLGLFRSDYMLHQATKPDSQTTDPQIKQVEINTYSCAGGTHANLVADMHQYLTKTGAYKPESVHEDLVSSSSLPPCHTIAGLASGLATAHAAYGSPKSNMATETGVIYIVQRLNINIADERPIEYALWSQDPPIRTYRVQFGDDVLKRTKLTPTRELLFYLTPSQPPIEVSVVYLRAGYDVAEYDDVIFPSGRAARLQLERSRAIKCPSILGHISGFKKVQQALTLPGALERFLPAESVAPLARTFAPLYPLDSSPLGQRGRKLALDLERAERHILKPSLEGGGHNVYRRDIPGFLASIPEALWHTYVLMEVIEPPPIENVLMSPRELYEGNVVSELGIFGSCLWRRKESSAGSKGSGGHAEIIDNREIGWSFKTKAEGVDEMSVVKGYGCFDSPLLI